MTSRRRQHVGIESKPLLKALQRADGSGHQSSSSAAGALPGGRAGYPRPHPPPIPPAGQGGQIRLAAAQFLGRLSWQRAMLRVPVAGTGTPGRRFRPPRKCCSSVPQGQAAVGAKATRKEAGRRRSWRRRLRAVGLAVPTMETQKRVLLESWFKPFLLESLGTQQVASSRTWGKRAMTTATLQIRPSIQALGTRPH